MKYWEKLGQYGWLLGISFLRASSVFRHPKRFIYYLDEIGVKSLPLVLLVGFFAGAIIAWQAAYQFRGVVTLSIMGGQTERVIVMEMGPVLTALVMSGRIGASMTAEIGAMKISEQIDALYTLSIDPIRYIVVPRMLAMLITLPVLTIFANGFAVIGAYCVSYWFLALSAETFIDSIRSFFDLSDMFSGLLKSSIFSVLISSIGCYFGLQASGGASELGQSTIWSFVTCAISILCSDFLLWLILF